MTVDEQTLERPATTLPDGLAGDLSREIRALSVDEWGEGRALDLVGRSAEFVEVLKKLRKVADYDEPVLLIGESGSGKELMAEALYLMSERKGRPFVPVNCPQFTEGNLTVSELFGHRRGSFTGAVENRKGAFERADGGLIFLDEIGDLHPAAQAMLLRALASGEFQPLGSDETRAVSVRVVAATNRTLDKLINTDEFREDLYFRLRYFLIRVPPLRERGDDWRLLLAHVLGRLRRRHRVEKRFSSRALTLLETYEWPGNVRQLISVVTTGYALADGELIEPEDFEVQLEMPERRRVDIVDELYRKISGGESFWDCVHRPFLDRDLNRGQLKAFIRRGLHDVGGSYRDLLEHVGLATSDYQKFMDFLRHHDLKP
ncbi:MAG: sigma 54-interacting transcriptional regulator [Acidobacteriota bacterium]